MADLLKLRQVRDHSWDRSDGWSRRRSWDEELGGLEEGLFETDWIKHRGELIWCWR
jgi:hypothetical protein